MITNSEATIWPVAATILGSSTFIHQTVAQSDKEINAQLDESFGQRELYHAFFTDLKKAGNRSDGRLSDHRFHRWQGREAQLRNPGQFVNGWT